MPVRLKKPYGGQLANTLYWGADQSTIRGMGLADDYIEQASDYEKGGRIVTTATANASYNATTYHMNSGSAQALTINPSGYWPKGTVLTVIPEGAGTVTIAAAGGVAFTGGSTYASLGQYKPIQLTKGAGEAWNVAGTG